VIKSFADRETEKVYAGKISRKLPPDIQQTARRKLIYLDEADNVLDLRAPPGNRLEALRGKRAGQYSIRINDQWRICFRWQKKYAYEVEITDYH
jgi:toxin HigB-1